MPLEHVILVDERDQPVGTMEKMEAHRTATLHRAFSVFVFNDAGELMLQQRALDKYHSGGLWTNTCCSHPRPGEETEAAAHRRLVEEMGFDCPLEEAFDFIYRKDLDQGLTEHELDHVFIGTFNGVPELNVEEAASWKFMRLEDVQASVERDPEHYTEWFKICLAEVIRHRGN